ncbi:hypothetical protein PCANC_01817 [Puccinia coronata f. sp. avenae]|uniref:Vacuolar protein sorting-associated protein 27 n=1 Tax=Puccinia coronata f. sp. avenae TaxID=200324 RepID=A0A2N5W599_9BASI|nr:hypothetical protein PCANC_01817 [Puccinia coronata f. sp. avenae]
MASSNGFWWWSSTSAGASTEFDRLLETCTSSNLPSSTPPPITHSLNLSDLIRSSAVPASHALKSLQKRLDHPNPNVQLLVISVIDVCVKNSGDNFLKEVAGREFSEDCAQIISNPASNREVKEKLKREFQNWALAFESVPMLASSELVTNYRRLKTMGIDFPQRDPLATAAMVDSMSAPEWRDSTVCERCRTAFSFTNRKHHCRNCGGVFDGQCSGKKRALPHFGVTESVRVCDGCERTLAAGVSAPAKSGLASARRNSFSGESSLPSPSKLSVGPNNHQRSATIHSGASARASHRYTSSTPAPQHVMNSALTREQADLERAIALSLQESAASQHSSLPQASSAPNHPSYHTTTTERRSPSTTREDETDEPELAAAIAASLRDAQLASNPHPSAPMPTSPSRSLETLPPRPPLLHKSVSEEHLNTLLNFSADVDTATRLGQLVPSNSDLNNRHAQAEVARLDLVRGIENAERRTYTLKEMNEKLSQAVKLYDRLLSDQIMYRTRHVESSVTSAPTYPHYANHPPLHTDHPAYQPTSNQAVFSSSNQAPMHLPHNPAGPYPAQAVPIARSMTNISPSESKVQADASAYPAQPHSHQISSSYTSQQYGYSDPQPMPPPNDRGGAQHMGHNQAAYSQEPPAITLSHAPGAPTHSVPPAPIQHREVLPTQIPWASNNASNEAHLSHDQASYAPQASNHPPPDSSNYVNSQLPPMTQSPGMYALPAVHLAESSNSQTTSDPNHFHAAHELQTNQPKPHVQAAPGPSPVPHHHQTGPGLQAHPNAPLTRAASVQGNNPMGSVTYDMQASPGVSSSKAPATPEPHAQGPGILHNHQASSSPSSSFLLSAPQPSAESAAPPLPSFPSVPNTQLSWSHSSPAAPYHLPSLDVVPTARQEEVAPLIEL